MIRLKNGQLCTIRNVVYRAKRRTCGCEGCFFENSFFLCPGILDSKSRTKKIDCCLDRIILIRVLRVWALCPHPLKLHRTQLKRKPQARKSHTLLIRVIPLQVIRPMTETNEERVHALKCDSITHPQSWPGTLTPDMRMPKVQLWEQHDNQST